MARIDTLPNFLTDVANSIREKTGKSEELKPEAYDVEIKSISSGATKSNIYRVATIEERDAITDMVEGDLCVVRRSNISNATVDSRFKYIIFPATVVLSEASTNDIYSSFRNDTRTIDVMVMLNQTSCRIDIMMEPDRTSIEYTSTDGITYTKTTDIKEVSFQEEIHCAYPEEWNNAIGYFIQVEGIKFEGLFEYKDSSWKYANIGIDIQQNELLKNSVVYTTKGFITGNLANDVTKDTLVKTNTILSDINKIPVESCENLFNNTNLENYHILKVLDTSRATTMKSMFQSCASTKVIPYFDTSNVTNMEYAFIGCNALESLPLLNLSKVTNMRYTFSYCKSLKEMPLFNTSLVTDFQDAVDSCESLTTFPMWDLSNATSTTSMFSGCINLLSVPNFNLSKVTDSNFMFLNCKSLTSLPNFDLSSSLTLEGFASGCSSLVDFPLYNCTHLVNLDKVVQDCPSLSDESLNNILMLAKNNTSRIHVNCRTTTKLGLNAEQKERIKSLSNYSEFISAGWTNK